MVLMLAVLLLVGVLLLSLVVTYRIKCYAQQHLLDIPNQRSSHQRPTPRGGGLGIVVAYFMAILFFYINGKLDFRLLSIFSASLLIAGIGFWDDHKPIPVRWRLAVHVIAAGFAILGLQGMASFGLGGYFVDLGQVGYWIGILFLVWMLNLFNFMDGIDGIATSEAVFVSAALAGFMLFINFDRAMLASALTAASLGFLICNWPPAKIFMGDVGSGFLGFVIGLLILVFSYEKAVFLYIGLILSAVFISDASSTLLTRFISGEKWYQAHCSHAYQHAARRYGHLRVVQTIWGINLVWLLPLAWAAYQMPKHALTILIIAYIPMIFWVKRLGAGKQ